jgi:hypothetical protein
LRPPRLFCHSTIISTVSRSAVSLIAMVPERECSTPTLIGAVCENAFFASGAASAPAAPSSAARRVKVKRVVTLVLGLLEGVTCRRAGAGAHSWPDGIQQGPCHGIAQPKPPSAIRRDCRASGVAEPVCAVLEWLMRGIA